MLETAYANNGTASRRGEVEASSSGSSVAGQKKGEVMNSQPGSQDKASEKMKEDKQDKDTSGSVLCFKLGRTFLHLQWVSPAHVTTV